MNNQYAIGQFREEDLENAIIQLFKKYGYDYLYGDNIHRKLDDALILDDLMSFINLRYASDYLTENELFKIKNTILNVGSNASLYLNNKEAFYLIIEGFDLVRDDNSKAPLHIDFIDFKNIDNNIFKVVNQFTIVKGNNQRRPDLLIFVNGIPICIWEFKSAIKEDTTIHDAWEQINIRYTRDIPNLLKYTFLSVISDGANNRLGSIFTNYEYYYAWNKANDKDEVSNGISSLLTLIEGAFSKDRLLSILNDFVLYPEFEGKNTEIVCRYPQYFGAIKMSESIKNHLRPNGDGKGGTYFGATGCGKTYTMLFMSKILITKYKETFNNPTIIVITDRDDLNSQTKDVFISAKKFLHENDIRDFDSREDLKTTLDNKASGGVYITTIQKFCESTGLLSQRNNIICISDEAHRTQTNTVGSIKKTDEGIIESYGFAYYLRKSLPNATYCGFTGTPIDETIAAFGDIVDSYTMKQASDDGITVRIAYEPRLARVIVSDEQAKEIEEYYKQCEDDGASEEQIQASKRAMSNISKILSHPDVLKRLSSDIVSHYETLCNEKPKVTQKAMIVCPDRPMAFKLLQEILKLKPEWGIAKKSQDDSKLAKNRLDKLTELPKINLVATRGANDPKDLFDLRGDKAYRHNLEVNFKNNDSNFTIAIVVDMWITGFDVPSLSVMYITKPIKKHTLIQTISRVNRVFAGKDKGLVIDYIGIKGSLMEALKIYGDKKESPIDDIKASIEIFKNQLYLIDALLSKFNADKYFNGTPLERLLCLNNAAEYVQLSKEVQDSFMLLSRQLKAAYEICYPSGDLSDEEIKKAQFYLAIRSIIYKQTKGDAPDAEIMNKTVEKMVSEALTCTGVESILDTNKEMDLYSPDFEKQLEKIRMPVSKYNALLKLLQKVITDYKKANRIKALEFDKMLKKVVYEYNNRDKLVFTSEVVSEFIDGLSDELINILNKLKEDKTSFEKMGISFEEKAFYDVLVKVRDDHNFKYDDEKCIVLAKKIKELVDKKSLYADWSTRSDIKSQLNMDLTILLYQNGYPPEWNEDVFAQILSQAENFKKYNN